MHLTRNPTRAYSYAAYWSQIYEILPGIVERWFDMALDLKTINVQLETTRSRSQSCPFCRDSLKRVNSGDLWVFTDSRDVVDMTTLTKENLRRLFMYIEKLPLIVPDSLFDAYDSHLK